MSNYPWLKEKKMETKMNRMYTNNTPTSIHAGLNRDIRFTGYGKQNEVAEVTNDGQPIHRGELMFSGPGSGQVITDAMSSRELMSNPVIAGRVQGFCSGGYKKGYQSGGYTSPLNEQGQYMGDTGELQRNIETQRVGENVGATLKEPVNPNITAPNTDDQVKPTVAPSADILRQKGLSAMERLLAQGTTAGRIAGQKELSDMKSTQDIERQVMKQEQAQKGIGASQAAGQLARLTGQQQGQLAETGAKIGIEQLQAKERAAGQLAAEGKVQSDIDIARAVQGLNEDQFGEFTRQFNVGSDQWDKAFEERRKQFDVGSEQWQQSFNEQQRQYDQNFQEQIRQFDVGSSQWEKAYDDDRAFKKQQLEEQKRQFDVGSEQWEKLNTQQIAQWNKSFEEQKRQFEVGSSQWEKVNAQQQSQWDQQFKESVRQFDVGSEQWKKAFDEEQRKYDQNFQEQIRQFDVGSDQWERAFEDKRDFQWKSFEEQKRQFEVGSEQWEKANSQQQDQWKQAFDEQRRQFEVGSDQWSKTFAEERRRYDNEDDRWWKTFDEQRRQFDVGSDQWNKSFTEQKRQFEVGSEQWNKTHDLQVKDFQRALDMDKHTVAQWKDNVAFRDKAYLDTRSDAEARLEMERAMHEKNLQVIDLQIDTTKNDQNAKQYWQGSERMFNYATTHIDGFNAQTGQFTPDAEAEMFQWFKTKYPGAMATVADVNALKTNPAEYDKFKAWAAGEWKAATDKRLTNPYDKMLYDVNTSSLDDKSKKIISDILTSPEALSQIAGIVYDPKTDTVQVQTKDKTTGTITPVQKIDIPNLNIQLKKMFPNLTQSQQQKKDMSEIGPVGPGPGPKGPGPEGPKGPGPMLV